MKLTPYKKILAMTKEAVDVTLAAVRAKAAKKRAELEIAKLDETLATLQNTINEECAKKDVNFERIIELLDDHGIAERRKGQFEKIVAEMFPDEE